MAVDVARGVAIVGVVFNHAVDGLISAGTLSPEGWVADVNAALYLFRLPALVFLVGLFIPGGVTKRGRTGYVGTRTRLLVWLFVIWQVLQGVVEVATGSVRNGSTNASDLYRLWAPVAHLWFLPFLAIATALVVALSPWRRGSVGQAALACCFVVGLFSWGWDVYWFGLRGLALLPFLAVGAFVGIVRMSALLARPGWQWAAVGSSAVTLFVLVLPIGVVPGTEAAPAALGIRAMSMLAAWLGVVALVAASSLLARTPAISTLLAAIGRVTLPIYLAHVTVVAGARIVLMSFGVTGPSLLLFLVPLGLAVPYVAWRCSAALHLRWLFDFPGPPTRSSTREQSAPRTPAVHRDVITPRGRHRARR
ncbi:acyltransferase family protein [Modestobacter italicus]|uniref:acyltransferase family protein n=1 Tax=Modestobacter italicus (strain DSM 44449 / CECT 9708 / BC 501) TaxID=2732864 RepID=UPI0005A02B1A|nr:acyltransferase [Modestobacter marinus]